jgi:hypothetical protein
MVIDNGNRLNRELHTGSPHVDSRVAKTVSDCSFWLSVAFVVSLGIYAKNGSVHLFLAAKAFIMWAGASVAGVVLRKSAGKSAGNTPTDSEG